LNRNGTAIYVMRYLIFVHYSW